MMAPITGSIYTLRSETAPWTFEADNTSLATFADPAPAAVDLKSPNGPYIIPRYNGILLQSVSLNLPYSFGFAQCGAAVCQILYGNAAGTHLIPELAGDLSGFSKIYLNSPNSFQPFGSGLWLPFSFDLDWPYWLVINPGIQDFDIALVNGPAALNGQTLDVHFTAQILTTEALGI